MVQGEILSETIVASDRYSLFGYNAFGKEQDSAQKVQGWIESETIVASDHYGLFGYYGLVRERGEVQVFKYPVAKVRIGSAGG